MTSLALISWFQVASFLQAQAPGTHVYVRASQVEHPRDAGMAPRLMIPLGQRANYRLDVNASQQLTVLDFVKYYLARLDPIETDIGLEATLRKAPGSVVIGTAALGALIGLACARSQEAAFAGAALGGLVALAGVAAASAEGLSTTTTIANEVWASSALRQPKNKSSSRRHPRSTRYQSSAKAVPLPRVKGRQCSKSTVEKSNSSRGQET